MGRKYCMMLFWFSSALLFRIPVNIEIFGSFLFLREEQCDWIIDFPFIAISALKFQAADWVLFQQNSQCAAQLRTETGISKRGHSCDFTKIHPELGQHQLSSALQFLPWKVCISISELLLSAKVSCAFHTSAAQAEFYCFSQSWRSGKGALWCHRQLIEVHYLETEKVTRGT